MRTGADVWGAKLAMVGDTPGPGGRRRLVV